MTVTSSASYCIAACEASLARLRTPYIDLCYCHRLSKSTPMEETVTAMAQLQREGKVRYLGLSECSAKSLRRACQVAHIAAVQAEYSPFTLDIEAPDIGLLAACRELGVAVVAYSPLDRGMLGGAIRLRHDSAPNDFGRLMLRFSEENFSQNLQLVDEIGRIARKKGCTPSQLTLAWLMVQRRDVISLPGTAQAERLGENLGALEIELTREEKEALRAASERADVRGDRYPEAMMADLFADTMPMEA